MDRVVAARKLVAELVKAEQIEVRRAEIVGRDIAKLCDELERPPSARELEDFLGDHSQVTELYASANLLEELIYRHLTPPPDPAKLTDVRHPELERQIREEPDRAEHYMVYADWLQEQNDPMGELLALGVKATAGGDDERVRYERFLAQHRPRFLGDLAPGELDRFTIEWRNGVVRSIADNLFKYDPTSPELWTKLLALRVCDFVQRIALTRSDPAPVLARARATPLRALELSRSLPAGAMRDLQVASLTIGGDRLDLAVDDLPPTLVHLGLHANTISVAPQRLDIRELGLRATRSGIAALRDLQLPRLERLAITVGYGAVSVSTIVKTLTELELPALTDLAISRGDLDVADFAKLGRSALAPRLRSLALTALEIDDARLAAMVKKRGELVHLETIDLSDNELTRTGIDAASALAAQVISRRQEKPGAAAALRLRWFGGGRREAAEEIAIPSAWQHAFVDGELRWARYAGTTDYELFVTADLSRYGCTCPSSYQPCKHVVALAMIAERMELQTAPAGDIEARVAGDAQ